MSDSPGRREVAHRVFAAEYDDATLEYSESDEERAPNYVLTPTGARVNRLFFVGVLTEVEWVSDDVLRARIADPTGAFVVYAGQYQPEAVTAFESIDPPEFVAVTGKARTFSPDDSDRVFSSVRPESVNVVDAETRNRWVVGAAERTLARASTFAAALELDARGDELRSTLGAADVDESLAAGIPVALDHYGTTEGYLAGMVDLATDALQLVAGDTDEVAVPGLDPDTPDGGVVDRQRITDAVPQAVVDFGSSSRTGDATDAPGETGSSTGPSDEEAEASEPAPEATEPSESETGTVETSTTQGGTSGSSEADVAAGASETGEPSAADAPAPEATPATEDAAGGAAVGSDDEVASADEERDVDDSSGADVGDFEPDSGDVGDFESDAGDVGDFEAGDELAGEGTDEEEATAGTGEVPEDVLDDEERQRIEEEYGTEFSTGTEVDGPGEAGIEPEAGDVEPPAGSEPDADVAGPGSGGETADEPGAADGDRPADDAAAAAATNETGDAPGGIDEAADAANAVDDTVKATDEAAEATGEPADQPEDVDLESALLDRMTELDDGDGADREALIESLVEEYGVSEADVEDAIDDALMGGKCYEPADGKLSPI